MAPLNARRFAREYTIFKKSPRATLGQDLRRAPRGRGVGVGEGGGAG